MSETIDPLTWLRDQVCANRTITLNPKTGELESDNSSLKVPKDAETAWKRNDGKEYYTIGSLWLAVKMRDAKFRDYNKEAKESKIQAVVLTE